MQKLSPNFLAELFKLMFLDINIVRMVNGHLTYQLIPKEWVGYKFLFKEAIEQYNKREAVPSLGVAAQKYAGNQEVQDTIEQIKKANLADKELIIDQLEAFIKQTEFELLSKKVHDLYEEGKKEEAIRVNAEESKEILNISLRKTGGNFVRVFADFKERMKAKKEEQKTAKTQKKILFGIDKLDELSYGGADPGDTVLWIMRSGIGKALSLGSDIMTPTGSIKMRDIKVGDTVLGFDGKPQSVVAIPYHGIDDCYRVTFSDGTYVDCNKEHLWTVYDRNYMQKLKTYSLRELIEMELRRKPSQSRCRIPMAEGVDFEQQIISTNPYTMGFLLGSESSGDINVINADQNKFIPREYIYNSKEIRIEVLRGLFDKGGYVNEDGLIEIAFTSEQMVKDIQFIARSLGCFCHPIQKRILQDKEYYHLRVVPPKGLSLFYLSEKVESSMDAKKLNFQRKAIISIEYIGKVEQQCITVSNPDGLFLTNDFIVTHNSTVLRWHGYAAALEGEPVLHIQLEGGIDACVDKYDQIWTNQSFSDIKKGNIRAEDEAKILKACQEMKFFGQDINVYGFERFGEASMSDIRNLVMDYVNIHGTSPRLIILDSIDLAKTGVNNKMDNDPEYLKYKLQRNAQLLKDIAVEFNCVVVTAAQTCDVPIEVWNNEDRVIDRSYTEGDRTLVKPFSFVFTGNMTVQEKKEKKMRIFIDKLRDYKDSQMVFTIASDYDRGRFYDREKTMSLYYDLTSKIETPEKTQKITSRKTKTTKI